MITTELMLQIKAAAPINEIIGEHIALEKVEYYKGICPFCKKENFRVQPVLGIYKCFDCCHGGDIFTFIQKFEKISFVDAFRNTAKKCGIDLPDNLFQQSTESETEDDLPF